jgi:hypothetical protein
MGAKARCSFTFMFFARAPAAFKPDEKADGKGDGEANQW